MLEHHLVAKTSPKAIEKNILFWGKYRITLLSERLFRVEKSENHDFCDEATQVVWFRDMPPVEHTVEKENGKLLIHTKKATLVLFENIKKCYVIIEDGKKRFLDNRANLKGTYRTLDCCEADFRFTNEEMTEGYTISLGDGVVSKNGIAILDDSLALILDENGELKERKQELDIYIFAFGNDYRAAVSALCDICGKIPLIPRFALGNWWSRYHAYTDEEYLMTVDRLKKRNVPLTVATVDMDWHWSTTLDEKKGITAAGKNDEYHGFPAKGWTGYSWNTDLFPDYRAFLKKLHERNLYVTLNLHPALGVRFFEDKYPEMAREMGIDPKTEEHIPFDFTSSRYINAYFKVLHKPLEHDGVDFWWIDWQQGTESKLKGLDPLFALNHYHTLDNAKEHMPLILSRYSGVGAHRYPIGFSGDTFITWKTLSYMPYFTSTASNIGYTWWSHDIGGHMLGYKDDELFARFVQFGVFSPINRLHCTDSRIATKEPSVYMNGKGLIVEEFLRIRHRMIPYLYSASVEANKNSRALIEPMYYEYPNAKEAYKSVNQYMFGSELLVAPVIKKGDAKGLSVTKVWLPEGQWTDIFTGYEYKGGRVIEAVRTIDYIPVFAKSGAIFILDSAQNTNSIDLPKALDVLVTTGDGKYVLHEGDTQADVDTVFSVQHDVGLNHSELTFRIKTDAGCIERRMNIELRNIIDGNVNVFENGKNLSVTVLHDDCLHIIIESVKPESEYDIVVISGIEEKYAKRNRELIDVFTRIEGNHLLRSKLCQALITMKNEDIKAELEKTTWLTKNEKKRILETLLCE